MTEPDSALPPWLDVDAHWYAEIARTGFGYRIQVTNGVMGESGIFGSARWALTRWGAVRRGRRVAARHNCEPQWERV